MTYEEAREVFLDPDADAAEREAAFAVINAADIWDAVGQVYCPAADAEEGEAFYL